MPRKDKKLSKDIGFLSTYYSAQLADFNFIHESEIHIDTKSNVILASGFAVLALILGQDNNTFLIIAAGFVTLAIIVGIVSSAVKDHAGPLSSEATFENDIAKGSEVKTMHDLIEDIESYSSNSLGTLFLKKVLYYVQIGLLSIALIIALIYWFLR